MRRGVGRRGPGLVGTMARTAVIAGTATAVSRGVSGHMDAKEQQKQQAAAAQDAAFDSQAQLQEQQDVVYQQQQQMAQMQQQMAQMQAQQAQAAVAAQAPPPAPVAAPAAAPASSDLMAQLQQLAQLKEQGILSDEEFTAAKAKLLAGG